MDKDEHDAAGAEPEPDQRKRQEGNRRQRPAFALVLDTAWLVLLLVAVPIVAATGGGLPAVVLAWTGSGA